MKMKAFYKIKIYDFQDNRNYENEETADYEAFRILLEKEFSTYEEAYARLGMCAFAGGCEIVKIFIQTKTSK